MIMDRPVVVFDEEQIRQRIEELGREITTAYSGNEICVVALMKNCLIFMADLIREIPLQMTCHFLRASALQEGPGDARTDIVYSTEIPYEGRHILLLEDVVDTGITLRFLLDHIGESKPAQLKVCTLIDKPGQRKVDVVPDWTAFTLNESRGRFLVGYGLDFAEHYRGLPYIGAIAQPSPNAAQKNRESGVRSGVFKQ
jgi:hypoxanthine phosphoribosyltransferase